MRPLDFNRDVHRHRHRLSYRAWYIVYGADRIQEDRTITSEDIAESVHNVYHDIEPSDIAGVLEAYVETKKSMTGEE